MARSRRSPMTAPGTLPSRRLQWLAEGVLVDPKVYTGLHFLRA